MKHKHTSNEVITHAPTKRCVKAFAGMALVTMLASLVGGCANEKLTTVKDESEFLHLVLESKQPVMVEFSKDSCPTCDVAEPELVKISKEYAGRVKFYKFMLLDRFFQPYSVTIRENYNLQWVPSVVLFVDGQEKQRWVWDYTGMGMGLNAGDRYRHALTELVGPPLKPTRQ